MEKKFYKASILSIDAWGYNDVWTWNNSYSLEDDVYFREDQLTSRKILNWMRKSNYLSKGSIGKVKVIEVWPIFEIQIANTSEPILAVMIEEN